jgi:excisionase family DNA binding protein
LSSSEAARYLGVSLCSVRRWADAGALPCWRTPGGHRRFELEQLQQLRRRALVDVLEGARAR